MAARQSEENKFRESPMGKNAYLRDELDWTQTKRADVLGRGERTIRGWDQVDRDRALKECLPLATYPRMVIDRIIEAVAGSRRAFATYGDSKERFKEIRGQLREAGACRDRWPGQQMSRYVHTIMAAEKLDNFKSEFIKLGHDHPDLNDYNFDLKLEHMAGMGPKARDTWVAQKDPSQSVSN